MSQLVVALLGAVGFVLGVSIAYIASLALMPPESCWRCGREVGLGEELHIVRRGFAVVGLCGRCYESERHGRLG